MYACIDVYVPELGVLVDEDRAPLVDVESIAEEGGGHAGALLAQRLVPHHRRSDRHDALIWMILI